MRLLLDAAASSSMVSATAPSCKGECMRGVGQMLSWRSSASFKLSWRLASARNALPVPLLQRFKNTLHT